MPPRAPAKQKAEPPALDPARVYFVDSDHDDTVLLALGAKITPQGIEWFDTVRDRGFVPRSVMRHGDAVRFETERARYELRPLTIEIYNQRVIAKVDGHPVFRTTEEVQRFFRALLV